MRRYIVYKTMRYLLRNTRVYWGILLQICLGMFTLHLFLSISVSLEEEYAKLLEDGRDKEFQIVFKEKYPLFDRKNFDYLLTSKENIKPYEFEELMPFSEKDYLAFRDASRNRFDLLFFVRRSIHFLHPAEGMSTYYVFYVTDEFFTQFEGHDATGFKDSYIYMGNQFQSLLEEMNEKNTVNPGDIIFSVSKGSNEIHTWNDTFYKIKPAEVLNSYDISKLFLGIETVKEINATDIAIIPIEEYYPFYHPKDIIQTFLFVRFHDPKEIGQGFAELFTNLYQNHHSVFEYKADNLFEQYVRKTETLRENSRVTTWIAGIMLAIVGLGLMGVLLLMYEKRKKGNAISLLLGASKQHLIQEMVMEGLSITLIGGFLGVILSWTVLHFEIVHIQDINISSSAEVTFFTIGLSALIGILSVIPGVLHLNQLAPIESLRNQ